MIKLYIKIIREKKKFVGRIIPYYCIINYELKDFKKYINLRNYALNENVNENINCSFFSFKIYKNVPRGFDIDDFINYIDNNREIGIIPLSNGSSEELIVENKTMPMFVVLFTSTGVVFSNQIYIVPNLKENTFLIKTEYNFKSGSEVIIKKLNDTFYEK